MFNFFSRKQQAQQAPTEMSPLRRRLMEEAAENAEFALLIEYRTMMIERNNRIRSENAALEAKVMKLVLQAVEVVIAK